MTRSRSNSAVHRQQFSMRSLVALVLIVPIVLLFTPILLVIGIPALLLFALSRLILYSVIWLWWLPRGKDVLLVSSNSPVWGDYIKERILPLIDGRVIVLNWSERSRWPQWSLRVFVFRAFAGRSNFNPMVVLFKPLQRARVFRFYSAFRDWKHGHAEGLEKLRRDLLLTL